MLAGAGNKGGVINYINTGTTSNLIVKHDPQHPIGGLTRGAKDAFEEAERANQERGERQYKL